MLSVQPTDCQRGMIPTEHHIRRRMYQHHIRQWNANFTCIYNIHILHIQVAECLALKRNTSGEWDRFHQVWVSSGSGHVLTYLVPQWQQVLAKRTVQESVSFWWFLKLTVMLIIMCLYCTWLLVTGLKQYYKRDVFGTLKTCIFLCRPMCNQCRFVTLSEMRRNQTAHMRKYSGCYDSVKSNEMMLVTQCDVAYFLLKWQ